MNLPGTAPAQPAGVLGRILPFWFGFAALYLIYRWPYIAALKQADPDDTLRLVQVRDLLAGQGWFDLHQYRIDPPQGVVMHWSRLVDLPIAAVEMILRPVLGATLAEQAASVAVPLATFGVILILLARIARRLFDSQLAGYCAVLAGTSFPIVTQILPTRVDHHGWQIVAALGALLGLTDPEARRGGRIAGFSLAIGMAISLELLPVAALFAAVLAFSWLRRPQQSERFITFMIALAGGSVVAFALTRGPDWTNYCDAVSPAYLASLCLAACGSAITVRLAGASPLRIAAGLAISGAAAGVVLVAIAPACLAGPFGSLDPLLKTAWHDNVLEGLPVWWLDAPAMVQWVVPPFAGLVAAVALWRNAADDERSQRLDYLLLLAGSLLLGTMVLRSMAFAIAFALVPLAWLVRSLGARLETARGLPRKLGLAALLLVCVMPALPVYFAQSALGLEQDDASSTATAANGSVSTRDPRIAAAALGALPRGTIFAPLDEGPRILLHTAHAVVATGHHRGAASMHDVMVGFLVDPPVARTILARHGARYVVLDVQSNEVGVYRSLSPNGLAARLSDGRIPDWLTPLPMPRESGLLAFAVNTR
ncbi:hypothetical protein [Novosphingobium sp.]|uniref:hypothetical protein n=1 Tax=Novosphingobium sp. TaxID=1874826 RepID=UPI0025D52FA5|nr:hypothetical protein [Novosphingobium sp.]